VVDSAAALEGARAILIERFAEDATLIGTLRVEVWARGRLSSRVREFASSRVREFASSRRQGRGWRQIRRLFRVQRASRQIASHRILALFRGEKEEVLTLELVPDPAAPNRGEPGAFERQIANHFKIADHGPATAG
jgi:protein Tex